LKLFKIFNLGDLMIFIYNCYGGTHSSSLAAAAHLKKLPLDRTLSSDEILNVDYFNKLTYKDMGKLIFRGTDEEENKVFTLGRGTSKAIVPCIKNLIELLDSEVVISQKIILSNMSPTVPLSMTLGGFFSRGMHIDLIGVPLLVIGAKKAFSKIVELVNVTKESARTMEGPVVVLENKEYEANKL